MIRSLFLLSLFLLASCNRGPDPLAADPNLDLLTIPPFTLTDHTGNERTEDIFTHPGLTVLDFTFTSCPLICPSMNTQMLRLQRELAGLPVRLVSITVDPTHDTPEQLAAHAQAIGADTTRWTFLTGDPDTIQSICETGLKMAITTSATEIIARPNGTSMNNISHPQKFILIRHDATPIGIYTGTNEADVTRLIERIRYAF